MSGYTYPEVLTVRIEQHLARGWSVESICRRLDCTEAQVLEVADELERINREPDRQTHRRRAS